MKPDSESELKDYETIIGETAKRMWREAGEPQGRDLEFWLSAEEYHDKVNVARIKGL